jgi:hypothetical protein
MAFSVIDKVLAFEAGNSARSRPQTGIGWLF